MRKFEVFTTFPYGRLVLSAGMFTSALAARPTVIPSVTPEVRRVGNMPREAVERHAQPGFAEQESRFRSFASDQRIVSLKSGAA